MADFDSEVDHDCEAVAERLSEDDRLTVSELVPVVVTEAVDDAVDDCDAVDDAVSEIEVVTEMDSDRETEKDLLTDSDLDWDSEPDHE